MMKITVNMMLMQNCEYQLEKLSLSRSFLNLDTPQLLKYGDFSNIADTYLSLVNWLQKMLSIRFQDPIALSVVEVIVIDYQTEIVSIPYIDINPYTPNLEESAYFAWADEFDF